MSRPFEGFENRLERLESGEHRALFDSKVRSLMTDSASAILSGIAERDEQVTRLLSLMEDLAKRMDVLDRKNRSIAEEMRQRDRRDRRRRQVIAAVAVAVTAVVVGGWATFSFDSAPSGVILIE